MGGVLSEEAVSFASELTDKLDALSALLRELIGGLSDVAAAQAALRQHSALLVELHRAMANAQSATLQ